MSDSEANVPRGEHRFPGTSTNVEGVDRVTRLEVLPPATIAGAFVGSLRTSAKVCFFFQGQTPSISTASDQLSTILTATIVASTATLSAVWSTMTVLTMSATIRTSRPSRMTRPRCFRK